MTFTANERGEVDLHGKLYAVTFNAPTQPAQVAQGERIAACLNMCEGIPTEQFEEFLEELHKQTGMIDAEEAFCEGFANEQLEATSLKEIVNYIRSRVTGLNHTLGCTCKHADCVEREALIAKLEAQEVK